MIEPVRLTLVDGGPSSAFPDSVAGAVGSELSLDAGVRSKIRRGGRYEVGSDMTVAKCGICMLCDNIYIINVPCRERRHEEKRRARVSKREAQNVGLFLTGALDSPDSEIFGKNVPSNSTTTY